VCDITSPFLTMVDVEVMGLPFRTTRPARMVFFYANKVNSSTLKFGGSAGLHSIPPSGP